MTEYTPEEWEAMPLSLPQIDSADGPYELKQTDANVWGTLVPAKADDETKGAMSAIKDLFGTLAEAASTAQGDRRITNIYIDELEKINKKLSACLTILLQLIEQLETKDTESQETLQQLQAKIHNAPNLDLIKTELQGLVELMGNAQVNRGKFRTELATLATQIKKLCEEGDRLKTNMERGSGGKVSEEDGDGGGGGNVSTSRRESEPRLQPESGIPITVEGIEYNTGYVVLRQEYLMDAMGREDRNQGKKPIFGLQRGGPFKVVTKREGGAGRQGKWVEKEVMETRIPPDINRKRKIELLKSTSTRRRGTGDKSLLIGKMRSWDRDNGYLNIAESEDGVYPKEFMDIMEGGRRRRTRKKRAGWRTPEKGSPMRTLYTKENKKRKNTKKKKNKRKKRKKKGTRRRKKRKR